MGVFACTARRHWTLPGRLGCCSGEFFLLVGFVETYSPDEKEKVPPRWQDPMHVFFRCPLSAYPVWGSHTTPPEAPHHGAYRNTMAYHCLSALVLLPGAFIVIVATLQMVVNATGCVFFSPKLLYSLESPATGSSFHMGRGASASRAFHHFSFVEHFRNCSPPWPYLFPIFFSLFSGWIYRELH